MGTRALIKPFGFDGKEICTIYMQYDGYPDGYPLDLFKYLAKKRLVNGYNDPANDINGMDDLTAQAITFLKMVSTAITSKFVKEENNGEIKIYAGNVYVMPAKTRDVGEEYVYEIRVKEEYVKELFKEDRFFEPPAFTTAGDVLVVKAYKVRYRYDKKRDKYIPVRKLMFEGTMNEYISKFDSKTQT